MKKFFVLTFLLYALQLKADVIISNPISTDTTWGPENGVYIINSNFSVISGATLTIEPGTMIKVRTTSTGGPSVLGKLIIKGTADLPVYFTSIQDDSVGGDTGNDGPTHGSKNDWQGLYFKKGSIGEIERLQLSYAGYGGYGYGDLVGIENNGGSVNINNSYIHDNGTTGILNKNGNLVITNSIIENHELNINIENGTSTISNNQIKNSSFFGLYDSGNDPLVVINNKFVDNSRMALISAYTGLVHEGNTVEGPFSKGFGLSGYLPDNYHLHSRDLPILMTSGTLTVNPNTTVYIDPGTIFKFGNGSYIDIMGDLEVLGSSNSKVYFTSLYDDTVGGDSNADNGNSTPHPKDWEALIFESGSKAKFVNSVIRYAGESIGRPGVSAAIYNFGGQLQFDNSYIGHNPGDGIYQTDGTTTATHLELTDQQSGIHTLNGYVSIHQSNIHNHRPYGIQNNGSNIVDATNNWWGNGTGPHHYLANATGTGDNVTENINFSPWIHRDPDLPNPVIIVPGIMGSYLVNKELIINSELWPNIPAMILPGDDSYLYPLSLSTTGKSTNNNIKPTSIIKNIEGSDFFEALIDTLNNTKINGFIYDNPYDWRLDISDNTKNLKDKIDEIKILTGADRVTLVAHSMGGLLVKKYLKDYGGNSIDDFIDIATPNIGSPKTFKILSFGDDMGFKPLGVSILNRDTVKKITQNMPSVYELLPSKKYFENSDPNYKYYVWNGLNQNSKLTFNQTQDYLKSEGRNSMMVDLADSFHQQIDNLDPADYGVKTYNIVGCGTPTLGQIYILDKKGDHYSYNVKMIDGDGTVPLRSALALPALKTYYVKGAVHATMPSTSGVKELVASLLASSTDPDISGFSNLSNTSTNCSIPSGRMVSFHSPITLDVYDSSNNHSGPNTDGDIENNIPGVVYELIGDNKFAFLPDGFNYTVKGKATGSGSFDARIETIVDGEVVATSIFNDVPLSESTKVKFELSNNAPSQISTDLNGDGTYEFNFTVSTTTNGFVESTGKIIQPINTLPEPILSSILATTHRVSQVLTPTSEVKVALPTSILNIKPPVAVARKVNVKVPIINLNQVSTKKSTTSVNKERSTVNTAIVYKSLGQSLKNFFRGLRSWFKTKL